MPCRLSPRRRGLAAAVFFLLGPTPAQAPDVAAAYAAFQTTAGGPWLVRWHGATGTPRTLSGPGLPLADWRGNTLDEARRQAGRALSRHADLLGLRDSQFAEVIGARMGRSWTFTFAQSHGGIPVVGGRVDVRIHGSGRLCHLGSTAWAVPDTLDPVPAIGAEVATAIAWLGREPAPAGVPQPGAGRAPRLVYWGDDGSPAPAELHLCWEIPIAAVDRQGAGPIGRVYVDAHAGAVLHYANDKHECGHAGGAHLAPPVPTPTTCTVMGFVPSGASPVSTPINEPLVGLEITVPGIGTFVTDHNGQFTIDIAVPTQVTARLDGIHSRLVQGPSQPTATLVLQPGQGQTFQLGAATSSADELAHTTCYHWVHRANELLRTLVGNSPQMAIADDVVPTVNIASACNAYYVGNTINFYHAAGGCNNTAGASVVAHEWGHGIDDRYGGISQQNGLSEGWGDICSMYLLDDPIIGHDFYTGGGYIRTGNNNRQYPSGSGVHAQGESWMGFAWKFRQNLRALLGTPQAVALSNEFVLATIAADAEDQADAVLAVFEAADDDGNLTNGTPWYNELVAACNAHSLPYPPLLDGYLANPTVLTATKAQLVPRFVELDAVPNTGSFAQVRLCYDDGQAHVRSMTPCAHPHRYRALLPGMPAPQALRYHFEAVHAGGLQLRLPPTGDYTYLTMADEPVWREDFEGGGPGWTHGATAGVDDWQIATPNGAGGAGWQDPPAAASGSRCAGTDLSGDGAYAPATISWLRSPPIDCTGHTNLWLRCRRWASCEASFFDALTIRVDGALVYQSYYPIQDGGWTVFEVALPGANNNPAMRLEFGLVSNGSIELGGWQIDDLEVYSPVGALPLDTVLTLLPEQTRQGTPLALSIRTPAAQPFLWAIGSTAGPTLVANVPPLLVGGSAMTCFGITDANGLYALPLAAPPGVLGGTVWYSQVLTLDAAGRFATSNPFINLFTP